MGWTAWPGAVVVIVLLFMMIFRRQLADLIGRIRGFKVAGQEFDTAAQRDQPIPTGSPNPADELIRGLESPFWAQKESEVREQLDRRGITGVDRERVLVRYLTWAGYGLLWEQAYAAIFGSQLTVLEFLNTAPGGLPLEVIRVSFVGAQSRYPELHGGRTLDQWLRFLEANEFITRDAANVAISLTGKEFLKYLIQRGLPLAKHG